MIGDHSYMRPEFIQVSMSDWHFYMLMNSFFSTLSDMTNLYDFLFLIRLNSLVVCRWFGCIRGYYLCFEVNRKSGIWEFAGWPSQRSQYVLNCLMFYDPSQKKRKIWVIYVIECFLLYPTEVSGEHFKNYRCFYWYIFGWSKWCSISNSFTARKALCCYNLLHFLLKKLTEKCTVTFIPSLSFFFSWGICQNLIY